MALGKKYTQDFTTLDGCSTITVELWKEGYVGSESSIPLAGPSPVIRHDSRAESDEMTPIRPSIVTLHLTRAGLAILEDVYEDATAWRLVVAIDSITHFTGPVIRDRITKSLDDYTGGAEYTLRATCGLGELQNLSFFDETFADGILVNERKTALGWILYLLEKTGLQLSVYTASRWFAVGMTSGDPLTQEYLRVETWTLDADRSRTCFDVLEEILAGRGLLLHQRDGYWHVYQRRLFFTTTYFTRYLYAYNAAGTTTGAASVYWAAEEISAATPLRIAGGIAATRDPFGSVGVRYEHGPLTNLIPNGAFIPDGSDFTTVLGWSFSGIPLPAASIAGVTETPDGRVTPRRAIRMAPIHEDTIAAAKIQLTVEGRATLDDAVQLETSGLDALTLIARLYAQLTTKAEDDTSKTYAFYAFAQVTYLYDGTTYYWKRETAGSGTWTTTNTDRVLFRVPGGEEVEIAYDLPTLPGADGVLNIILETCNDNSGVIYSGGIRPIEAFFWQAIKILPKVDDSGAVQGATEYYATESGVTGLKRAPVVVRTGTGPTILTLGAGLSTANAMLNNWGLDVQSGDPSGRTLAEWAAYEMLKQLRTSRLTLEATYRDLDPHPLLAINEDGVIYLPVSAVYDYRWDRTEVVAVEVRLDGFTPAFDAVADESVSPSTARLGGGTAILIDRFSEHVRNFSEWNSLTVTDENISGAAVVSIPVATIAEELAVLADGEFIAVAGLNGGVFEFEISGAHPAPINAITVVSKDLGEAVIPAGSGVYPSTGSLTSVQTQTRNALYQSIQSGGFAALTAGVDGAAITSLPVSALPFDLEDGWVLEVVSTLDEYAGYSYEVTVDGAHSAGATAIAINAAGVHADAGDRLKLLDATLTSEFTQTAAEIELRVTKETYESGLTADRLVSLSAGVSGTVTSLPVTNVPHAIDDNETLLVFNSAAQDWTTVTVNGAVSAGATTITIDAVSLTAQSGDPVQMPRRVTSATVRLLSDEIELKVDADGVIAAINVSAEGIDITADRIAISGSTTFASGYNPAEKIPEGGAADDVNANVTTISGGKITALSVTAAQIAAETITAAKIAAGTITGDRIDTDTITAANIATGTITAAQIAAGTITTSLLAFTPATSTNVIATINASAEGIDISADRITISGSTTFASGYNPAEKIPEGAAADDINANVTTIDGGKITALSVTASQIAAATITGAKIAAGTITATNLSVSTLSAITANLGAVTAGSITIGTVGSGSRFAMSSAGVLSAEGGTWAYGSVTTKDTAGSVPDFSSVFAGMGLGVVYIARLAPFPSQGVQSYPFWASETGFHFSRDGTIDTAAYFSGDSETGLVNFLYRPNINGSDVLYSAGGTDVVVADGGTGVSTLAANGVLYGNETSAVQALAVNATATKKYLQQVSSGAPSWQQIAYADLSGTGSVMVSDGYTGTPPTPTGYLAVTIGGSTYLVAVELFV